MYVNSKLKTYQIQENILFQIHTLNNSLKTFWNPLSEYH